MAIQIITDSTSDILEEEAAALGIRVLPMLVSFGDESFRSNIDITHEEFYVRLQTSKELPTTSQLTPADFLPLFEAARERGDSVVCILMAGALSGTVQSALIAKDMSGYDKIYVVDSQTTTLGLRLLAERASAQRAAGMTATEIAASAEAARGRIRLYAMVDTLDYLHRGGRLSSAVTVIGSFLKMKPILTLREGRIDLLSKARGLEKSMEEILSLLGEFRRDASAPVFFGYTADSAQCEQLRAAVQAQYGVTGEMYSVGSVIGTHAGPGAIVVVYLEA